MTAPVQRNLDGTWTVLSIWWCPDCTTREWLYTPLDDGSFCVTCNGCKRPIGFTRPAVIEPKAAPVLRAERED